MKKFWWGVLGGTSVGIIPFLNVLANRESVTVGGEIFLVLILLLAYAACKSTKKIFQKEVKSND